MFDTKKIDELAKSFADTLPPALKDFKEEINKNFHHILQNFFSKVDLVTREEFDTQAAVLAKTRKKLEKLEKQVKEIETTKKK